MKNKTSTSKQANKLISSLTEVLENIHFLCLHIWSESNKFAFLDVIDSGYSKISDL